MAEGPAYEQMEQEKGRVKALRRLAFAQVGETDLSLIRLLEA